MSVFVVVCITIDRYHSVCLPTRFKKIHTTRNAKIALLVSAVTASLIWLPASLMKVVTESTDCEHVLCERQKEENTTYYVACMEKNTLESTAYLFYTWTRQTVVSFIPIAILVILNALIIRGYIKVVRRRNNRQTNSEANGDGPFLKQDHNLIRMLYAVMISFFITMLPPGVANAVYTEFLTTNLEYEIFRAVANCLEILNHALNFYLYILLSKPLRGAVGEYFLSKYNWVKEKTGFDRPASDPTPEVTNHEEEESPHAESKKGPSERPVSKISILSRVSSPFDKGAEESSDISGNSSSLDSQAILPCNNTGWSIHCNSKQSFKGWAKNMYYICIYL